MQPERAYTVQRAVDDWLAEGLDGRSARTVRLNHDVLRLVTAVISGIELRKLTAHDVRRALVQVAAANSTRTVTLAHNALTRALRHAEANRHVAHNVAALVDTPKGQPGRPSKALTAEQATAVLVAAEGSRLSAYVVLCLMTGIRTEEARALRWDHVDLDAASIAVWRSVRLGGDTKTSKSRRTLGLPQAAVDALREHRVRQDEEKVAAGELWRDYGLVFTTTVGTELDAANVRRYFRGICKAAGIGAEWTPRELRHSFVSLLSASGVPWKRSRGWSATRARARRRSFTGWNSARSWSRGPRSWIRSSSDKPQEAAAPLLRTEVCAMGYATRCPARGQR